MVASNYRGNVYTIKSISVMLAQLFLHTQVASKYSLRSVLLIPNRIIPRKSRSEGICISIPYSLRHKHTFKHRELTNICTSYFYLLAGLLSIFFIFRSVCAIFPVHTLGGRWGSVQECWSGGRVGGWLLLHLSNQSLCTSLCGSWPTCLLLLLYSGLTQAHDMT
jgi:hypothetical protein